MKTETYTWNENSFTRDNFIANFQKHNRLIGMIAKRYCQLQDIEDSVADFFLYMIDETPRRWAKYDPTRAPFENWIGWQARGFFSTRIRSRVRYANKIAQVQERAKTPDKASQDPISGAMLIDQISFVRRRMSEAELSTFDALRMAKGSPDRACAMLGINRPALNARIRTIKSKMQTFGFGS